MEAKKFKKLQFSSVYNWKHVNISKDTESWIALKD